MKAIVLTKYGTPDDLELRELERPAPKDNEVLVQVHASAVNDWDWSLVRGTPFYIRVLAGLLAPKIPIIGCEVAGRIEAAFDSGEAVADAPHDEAADEVVG